MGKSFGAYEHFIPKVRLIPGFPPGVTCEMIHSIEHLEEVLGTMGDFIGFDTETSGLDAEVDFIVGYSFACNATHGYYVPVKHYQALSLGKESLDIIYRKMLSCSRTITYNGRFDLRMMEYAGYDMSEVKHFDIMKGIWFADTNVKMPSLKWALEHFLGWDVATFSETLGDAPNFYYLTPEESYNYAGLDSVGLFALLPIAAKFFKEGGTSSKVDNDLVYPLMRWENVGIRIDQAYLEREIPKLQGILMDSEEDVYSLVGYRFNIGSGRQLGSALESMGITTGAYTDKGQMKTSIDVLEKILPNLSEREKQLIHSLIRYSRLKKLISSFFISLQEEARRQGGRCRFAYLDTVVPTGRLASGSDKKNSFFAHMNVQAISKPRPAMWYVHDGATLSDEELSDGEVRVLDWVFSLDRKSDYIEEGFAPDENVRNAFLPEEGHYWVSIDFNAQELRIPAALSGEPAWKNAFIEGKDPHKSCYSVDTEFLTADGFRHYTAIRPDTLLAQYHESGEISYVPAGEPSFGDSSKGMVRFTGDRCDLLVTSNHRMYLKKNLHDAEARIYRAGECVEKTWYIRNAGIYPGHTPSGTMRCGGVDLTVTQWLYLVALYIVCRTPSDGYKQPKVEVVLRIETKFFKRAAEELRGIAEFRKDQKTYRAVLSSAELHFAMLELTRDVFRNSVIPEQVFRLGLDERQHFIWMMTELMIYEMRVRKEMERIHLTVPNRGFAKNFQRLLVISGYQTQCLDHVIEYTSNVSGSWSRFDRLVSGSKKEFSKVVADPEYYRGRTVCYSVPTGLLIVRRNNKVSVCGNTAIKVWGEEGYDKSRRKKAKICNFSLQYGGSEYTVQNRLGIPDLVECKKIVDEWVEGLSTLHAWQNVMVSKAKKTGSVTTFFGRPRRVKFYFKSRNFRAYYFGIRTVKNTLVQGCAADITKIALLKLWKNLLNPKLGYDCRFLSTIHDEVNFSITKEPEEFKRLLEIARKNMRLWIPTWPFPMEVGIEIGDRQGRAWAFIQDDEGRWVPACERVKEEEAIPEPEYEPEYDSYDDFQDMIFE